MPKPERVTNAPPPEGTTVFLIGMRPNRMWRLREWGRVFYEMGRMLRWLAQHPEAGLLAYKGYAGPEPMLVSYWSSPEALRTFAADIQAPHAPAWRWFTRAIGDSGSVGIWHETYVIGAHETIYSAMPGTGLGKAVGTMPIGAGMNTARQRLAREPA